MSWLLLSRDEVDSFLHFCTLLADDVGILLYSIKVHDAVYSEPDTASWCGVSPSYPKSDKE